MSSACTELCMYMMPILVLKWLTYNMSLFFRHATGPDIWNLLHKMCRAMYSKCLCDGSIQCWWVWEDWGFTVSSWQPLPQQQFSVWRRRRLLGCFWRTPLLRCESQSCCFLELSRCHCWPCADISSLCVFTARCYASLVYTVRLLSCVCLSVNHMPVLYRNGWTNRSGFGMEPLYPTLIDSPVCWRH